MSNIYDIFSKLKANDNDNGFSVNEIPGIKHHKIGISHCNYPMFFIKCESFPINVLNHSLEIISVMYNNECNLYVGDSFACTGYYTIITLKSDIPELQKYFIEIIYILINKIPETPALQDIRGELNNLVELFRGFSQPPLKTIQGIWAEMLVISCSIDTDYLVNSWHSSIYSKFDFNDGIDKIEVKSTIKDRRIHRFSISQLMQNQSSIIIIASIMTTETGIGLNIFDLREQILNKLKEKELISKVDKILSKTLGKDIKKATDYFFDSNFAIDSLKYYNINNIPTIASEAIPNQISSVKFDCDLTDINQLEVSISKSKLIASLNI
jgi:hypothetical protein